MVVTLIAFLVGYASIAFLLRCLSTHSTHVLVLYCIVVGAFVLAPATTETIS